MLSFDVSLELQRSKPPRRRSPIFSTTYSYATNPLFYNKIHKVQGEGCHIQIGTAAGPTHLHLSTPLESSTYFAVRYTPRVTPYTKSAVLARPTIHYQRSTRVPYTLSSIFHRQGAPCPHRSHNACSKSSSARPASLQSSRRPTIRASNASRRPAAASIRCATTFPSC